jgi:cytochrome c peroxidase
MNMRNQLLLMGSLLTFVLSAMAQGPQPPRPPRPDQGLPPVPVPPENPITEEKRVLGKILFWEEQLSSDNTMACGTCHIPSFAGGDPNFALHPGADEVFGTPDDVFGSPGVVRRDQTGQAIEDAIFGFDRQVTGRAAPSAFNHIYAEELFWDGRASETFVDPLDEQTVVIQRGGALESQSVAPILNTTEMAKDGRTWAEVTNKLAAATPLALATDLPPDVAAVLAGGTTYPDLFAEAFGDAGITPVRIAFAVATYERTLVADETPWDRFTAGEQNALTPNQQQGLDLLATRTVCFNCHRPPLFTNNNFHNTGLRPAIEDAGRMNVTGDQRDFGRFKTPSLRNMGLKDSMMHVGWISGTEDAIDFYNAGRVNNGHMQFTQDQTGIPGAGPGQPRLYNDILLPVTDQNGQPFRAPIVDFLNNGLTDPRVANETFPFDRPTLASERGDLPEGEAPEGETPEGEDPEGEVSEGEISEGEAPEGEGDDDTCHTGDTDRNHRMDLSELMRIIQFYNSNGLHCLGETAAVSEDGFMPGHQASAQPCEPHASDYAPQDWQIGLSELLRAVQFYNAGSVYRCPDAGTEDGHCTEAP